MSNNTKIVKHPDGRVNIGATARANRIRKSTLQYRLAAGMLLEEALSKPVQKQTGISRTSHFESLGRRPARAEYRAWEGARHRTTNPDHPDWNNWGGRGIKICKRWADSFEAFLKDMGPKPSPKHTLERKNNNGDYCPENCRWATRQEQARNTRRNIWVSTPWGKLTLAETCRRTGINRATIQSRVQKFSISYEEAIFNWKPLK